ncbi:MAG: tetratricopeptide repeat protein [Myxococcales bacterium]|nr:tetratricopeptide repeat protein [Myxococcales bacterium]
MVGVGAMAGGIAKPPAPAPPLLRVKSPKDLGLLSEPPPTGEVDLPAPSGSKGHAEPPWMAGVVQGHLGEPSPIEDLPAPSASAPAPAFASKGAVGRALAPDFPGAIHPEPPAPSGHGGRAGGAKPMDDLPAPGRGRGKSRFTPDFPLGSREAEMAEVADLPAPSGRSPAAAAGSLEFEDLPAPSGRSPAAAAGSLELGDLPAPSGRSPAAAAGSLELEDLPAPSGAPGAPSGRRTPFDAWQEADSEEGAGIPAAAIPAAALPAAALPDAAPGGLAGLSLGGSDLELDPPSLAEEGAWQLPAPSRERGADLPAPSQEAEWELPAPSGAELPGPSGRGRALELELDLPAISGAGLPAPARSLELELDLPAPDRGAELPGPSAGLPRISDPGGLDLELDFPVPVETGLRYDAGGRADAGATSDEPAWGSVELEAIASERLPDSEGRRGPPPPLRPAQGALSGAGVAAFEGEELELEDADALPSAPPEGGPLAGADPSLGDLDLGAPLGEGELEFDALPEEAPRVQGAPKRRPRSVAAKRAWWKLPAYTAGILTLLLGVGFALEFTPYGRFGTYFLERFHPSAGDPSATATILEDVDARVALDTFAQTRRAIAELGRARRETGLDRALLSRSLLHEALYQARFGADPYSEGRAEAIRARLAERGFDAPGAELARAADALRLEEHEQTRAHLDRARAEAGDDPFVSIVAGELELAQGEAGEALASFRAAASGGAGARAHWGIARALLAAGEQEGLQEALDATLEASPRHAGGRVEKARLLWTAREEEPAMRLLLEAVGWRPFEDERIRASAAERAAAWAQIGAIHELRGRRSQAREAYGRAIALEAFQPEALLGDGRVLLEERRYADALNRFQMVVDAADPEAQIAGSERSSLMQARLGIARAYLSLERTQEAMTLLQALAAESPDDLQVLLLMSRGHEALEAHEEASAALDRIIELAPNRLDGYVARAELHSRRGEPDAAADILRAAREHVEETAEVRRLMGRAELQRSRFEEAILEFQGALELDPGDMASLFGLGVAGRRAGRFEIAEASFEALASRDEGYPGLALERGFLYEARGDAGRAVEAYSRAHEEAPEDLDLLLRLGTAQVNAGMLEAARESLDRVIEERPESADAELYRGRIELESGRPLEAIRRFERALQLDPTHAEYHLYLAWAALDANELGRAFDEAAAALARDENLARAYWLRGRIRIRGGYVRDALRDLVRAKELDASMVEVYPEMANAYLQMSEPREAIRTLRRAVEEEPDRGEWWTRMAALLIEEGDRSEALAAARRGVELGAALEEAPSWLASAHRILGNALRRSGPREAATHYRRYLELAPESDIDRRDVERVLREL